jgi:hypothetical protein
MPKSSEESVIKRTVHLAAVVSVCLLSGGIAGCGREVIDLSKANDSYQCTYMKDVCREAADYEAKYQTMSAEEKKEMKTILDTYRSQCSNAIKMCNTSLKHPPKK